MIFQKNTHIRKEFNMKLVNKLVLPIALSVLVVAPASAKKPETFLGKIGTSVLQTINEHSFITAIALNRLNSHLLGFEKPQTFKECVGQVFALTPIALVQGTLIKALTKNFEIDPIQ